MCVVGCVVAPGGSCVVYDCAVVGDVYVYCGNVGNAVAVDVVTVIRY